jgi:uncharacterized pyridoxal phosphate-containing UPF0001 family protein
MEQMPKDISGTWLVMSRQTRSMAPFVNLIHGVDSFKLLKEINKQALKTTE